MAKKNHRIHCPFSKIKNLRDGVKYAYNQHTRDKHNSDGLIFDDKSYKLSGHYATLIGLLDVHCPKFKNDEEKMISESTLHKFFTGVPVLKKDVEGISFEARTIEILTDFGSTCNERPKTSNSASEQEQHEDIKQHLKNFVETGILKRWLADEIDNVDKHLQKRYDEDKILVSVEEANQAFHKYGTHPKILRHFFRFNMRLSRWQKIDDEVEKILSSNPTEEIFTLCKLATTERKLRDAYSNHNPSFPSRTETKITEAQRDLNSIPLSQRIRNKDFWYWQGRWYLEWWHYNNGVNVSALKLALSHFDESLKLRRTWFVLFYKCVVLKALRGETDSSFIITRENFTTEIILERNKRREMASIRTYRISSFLLNKDIYGLRNFLIEIGSTSSATDFSATMKHHLELIFFGDNKHFNTYKKILDKWDAQH